MMHLLHCLFFMEAQFHFELVAVHISQAYSTVGLMICLVTASLPSMAPEIEPEMAELPPMGVGDWTSLLSMRQFASTVTGVYQIPLTRSIKQGVIDLCTSVLHFM